MYSIRHIYSGFRPRETKCLLYVRNMQAVMKAQIGALLLCHKKEKKTKLIHGCLPTGVRSSTDGELLQDCHLVQHAAHSPWSLMRSGNGWKVCRHTFCLLITQISLGDGIPWLRRPVLKMDWFGPGKEAWKEKLLEWFCYISLFIMPERRTFIILQGSARAM